MNLLTFKYCTIKRKTLTLHLKSQVLYDTEKNAYLIIYNSGDYYGHRHFH